jgi:hypothetical protein
MVRLTRRLCGPGKFYIGSRGLGHVAGRAVRTGRLGKQLLYESISAYSTGSNPICQ